MKKIILIVLAMSGHVVFAGDMGSVCNQVNATTSCEGTSWDFGARALYLDPSYSGGYYRYAAVDNAAGEYENFNQNMSWGFYIEGSYHYNTDSDVSLNLYHIDQSKRGVFEGNFDFFGGLEAGLGITSINPQWNAVNLEFGQYVNLGENKHVRFHGGLQYARISISENLSGVNAEDVNDGLAFQFDTKSIYNGFGARVGADMTYDIGHNVSLYSNLATAVLAGYNKINNTFYDNVGENFQINARKTTMAPEFEAKAGVKYNYGMAMGDLTVDLGWMWIDYFNATEVIPSNFVLRTTPQIIVGNVGFQGLYFGLHWLGNGL